MHLHRPISNERVEAENHLNKRKPELHRHKFMFGNYKDVKEKLETWTSVSSIWLKIGTAREEAIIQVGFE